MSAALDPVLDLFVGLYAHQRTELELLLQTTAHRLLAWQAGSGKTAVAAKLGATLEGPKLYLGPASIKAQVARELVRWGGPGTIVQVIDSGRDVVDPAADWVVVNYDLLLRDQIYAQLIARRWSLLVIDESHVLRTPSAKRTRLVLGPAALATQADRVLALTGTPIVNSPADLFPLINRLCPAAVAVKDANGKLRRLHLDEFEAQYCIFRELRLPGGRTVRVPSGGQNLQELHLKLAPHMSRLRRADVLDLPPLRLVEYALTVAPSAALTDTLRVVPRQLLEQLQGATGDALLALLKRHATALATLRLVLGVAKAAPAAEHIAERLEAGEDCAVGFFHHRAVSDAMQVHLQRVKISVGVIRGDTPAMARVQLLDQFDRGDLQVLLLQNQSGSLGLNLQRCRYAVVVEPDWTSAVTEQSIGRVYRAGQTRDVTVEFLLIPNSLDEHVVRTARSKAAVATAVIEPQHQHRG